MLAFERQNFINTELAFKGSILISDMANKLNCSEETIRRDLCELEKKNRLIRVHGGAFLPTDSDKGAPVGIREILMPEEKNNMAEIAIKHLIKDKDTIFLDSSTTCVTLAKKIIQKNLKITIITNSLLIFKYYVDNPSENVKLIGLGGNYRIRACSFVGYETTQSILDYSADKCFLSPSALSMDLGILDNSSNECQVRKSFLKQSKEHYLICDNTKFEDSADFIISDFNSINSVVCNQMVSTEWKNFFIEKEINFIY